MFKKIMVIGCLVFSTLTLGQEVGKNMTVQVEEGTITLGDLLDSCQEISISKSSKRVPIDIPGKIISIKGIPYEVRYFSFEDTSGKIALATSFRDYVEKNKLQGTKSISTTPLPGIHFESFDFRRSLKSPLNDGVYFSMAVRKIENGDDTKSSPKANP
jgi:hypothetical protein